MERGAQAAETAMAARRQLTAHSLQFSSVQSLSPVRLFATPWTAARQASLSITNSRSLLKLMSVESVMPSNPLILVVPFPRLQSFPTSGSFQMSQFFTLGDQSIEVSASASVLLTAPLLGSMSEAVGDPASGFTCRFMTAVMARELVSWSGAPCCPLVQWVG